MLLTIPRVLPASQIIVVQKMLANAKFTDGKLSAGFAAQRVKNNLELEQNGREIQDLNNIVMGQLVRNPIYQSGALPYRVASPFYARYTSGMHYGNHVDDPVMGPTQGRYRSDVAITIFLNAPEDYEGGELVIQTSFGEQQIKLPAGDAVMYPSSSIHQVLPVTKGERLVAVTWLQSMIRDPNQRELLYDLNSAREQLLREKPDAPETKKIDRSYVNLVRMWSEV